MFGLKKKRKPLGGNGGSGEDLEVKDLSDQIPETSDAIAKLEQVLRGERLEKEQKGCGCW